MPTGGRISGVGFAIGNKGYVGTGSVSGFGSTTDFWEYDPSTDSWTSKAPVGLINRQEATGFALNGKGYIGTGDNFSSGTNYGDFYEWDPATNVWTQIDDFGGLKRRYLVSFVIGDAAYAGTGTNGTNFADFWTYKQTLGTGDVSDEALRVGVYPNPIVDQAVVTIQPQNGNVLQQWQFELYDLQGRVVHSQQLENTNTFNFNRNDLASGTYVFKVDAVDQQVQTGKLIIR
jgi:N-acetylneuraminic acid mutarotase